MHLLTHNTSYSTTVFFLPKNSYYYKHVNFHTFLNNKLDSINILSITSCAKHHSRGNYVITIWTTQENSHMQSYIDKFKEYKNIEVKTTNSDNVCNHVLLTIGGCWFEPRYVFLKPLEPLFWTYGRYVCVFNNGSTKEINDSFIISLTPERSDFKSFLNNDLMDVLMLPSSWIDPISVDNPFGKQNDYSVVYEKTIVPESYMIHCGNEEHVIKGGSLIDKLIEDEQT